MQQDRSSQPLDLPHTSFRCNEIHPKAGVITPMQAGVEGMVRMDEAVGTSKVTRTITNKATGTRTWTGKNKITEEERLMQEAPVQRDAVVGVAAQET